MKRNMSRRHFLKTGGLALAAMAMCPPLSFASSEMPVQKYISLRPPVGKRHFVSKAVEATIEQTRGCVGCLRTVSLIRSIPPSGIK